MRKLKYKKKQREREKTTAYHRDSPDGQQT